MTKSSLCFFAKNEGFIGGVATEMAHYTGIQLSKLMTLLKPDTPTDARFVSLDRNSKPRARVTRHQTRRLSLPLAVASIVCIGTGLAMLVLGLSLA